MILKQAIEALVFASQKPLLTKEIVVALRAAVEDSDEEVVRELAKTKEPQVAALLEELKIDYIQANRAFQLVEQASGWTIVTRPAFGVWVRQLYPESKPTRLSGPALETLAIIAYRQPITRADIEAVRGVAVDGVMQSLLDRSLVRIAGRADVPGRPLLYETTQVFMEHFGLRHLNELPNSDELRRVNLPTAPSTATEQKRAAKSAAEPEFPLPASAGTPAPTPGEQNSEPPTEPPSEAPLEAPSESVLPVHPADGAVAQPLPATEETSA